MIDRRHFLAAGAGLAVLPRLTACCSPPPQKGFSMNNFAMNLYGELRKTDGNVFCSPFSISTALGMTAAGAQGTTLSQMQKVLGLGENAAASDDAFAKAFKALGTPGKGYELAMANAIWAQTGYPWNPAYTRRIREVFEAAIHDVDYVKEPELSRKAINSWVDRQTKNKIKDLMPEGSVDHSSRLVLTNAIYFKGDWLKAFDRKLTQKAPFTLTNGTKKEVPLMYRSETLHYAESETAQVIKLPYKGNEISFIAALPRKPEKFAELEGKLEAEVFGLCTRSLRPTPDVKVWLPAFKAETVYTLNDALKKLGMPDAFGQKADFGGMVTGKSELLISLIVHKAFIEVNEEGTVAAAATGVGMRPLSVAPEPKRFRADRPFLFALRHEPTGTLLFLGRCTNP